MFIDINRFTSLIPNYVFLGVISGEIPEGSNVTLQASAFVSGEVQANSDVSSVVPAQEVLKIINCPAFQVEREAALRKLSK